MIEPHPTTVASDGGARARRHIRTTAWIRLLLPALLLAGSAARQAAAQGDIDPMHSPECATAQGVLERALQEAVGGSADARQALDAARKQALDICLGPQTGHTERSGAPASPIAVPSPSFTAHGGGRAMHAPTVTPPAPPSVAPPTVITTCDASGCWDSQGHRLNSMGPVLIGPQGVCALQPGAVRCPQ